MRPFFLPKARDVLALSKLSQATALPFCTALGIRSGQSLSRAEFGCAPSLQIASLALRFTSTWGT